VTAAPDTAAIIGSGLIGRSWAVVFARLGARIRIYDPSPQALDDARQWLEQVLQAESALAAAADIRFCSTVAEAVDGATHVQENAPEALEAKRALYQDLDRLVAPGIPICSSTSALLPSVLFEGLAGASRFLVAHPTNPPHVVPAVEIVPSPWTSEDALAAVEALLSKCGQETVRLRREVPGFLLNRLQAALVNEALRLVEEEVAAPEEIDKVIRSGLGLRWAFIGPFETMDLNASGGFEQYAERLGGVHASLDRVTSSASPWDGTAPALVGKARRKALPVGMIAARQQWRDRQIMALRALKASAEHDFSKER
jgi:3-hydroxyacyl-CoA dehydrogenase